MEGFIMNRKIAACIAALVILVACSNDKPTNEVVSEDKGTGPAVSSSASPTVPATPTPSATTSAAPSASPAPTSYANEADAKAAVETIEALKNKDIKRLSELVHADKGVQFSPYAFIEQSKDVRVKANELEPLWKSATKKTWGHYDGSGEPIELTFEEYYKKFIFNHDFTSAKQIGYNRTLGSGTTHNNLFELYPKDKFITAEYHFPGFDPKFEGNDWASLRLVYENVKGTWMLVAVIHDQWTT
jgi:uncharacterized lipoprotein NlpE involved in copper resistance